MSETRIIARDRLRCNGKIHEVLLTNKLKVVLKNHPKKIREYEEACCVISQKPRCKCYDAIELVKNHLYVPSYNRRYTPKNIKETLETLRTCRLAYRRGIESPPFDTRHLYRRMPVISGGITFARILRAKLRIQYAEPNWTLYHLVTFNEKTKQRVYRRQTEEALKENKSNCPICSTYNLEEFKNKIWAFEEMRCEYVVKLEKKEENRKFRCIMYCKMHNKDPRP